MKNENEKNNTCKEELSSLLFREKVLLPPPARAGLFTHTHTHTHSLSLFSHSSTAAYFLAREKKRINKIMSVDGIDDDFGDFENAKEEVTAPPPPPPPLQSTATTNVQQQQKSSALEFLSLTDEEFKAAVATAFGGGMPKTTARENTGRSIKGEEENMTSKTTRMTMKTIVEKEEVVKEGSQQEQQQKVEVSMAERMKVFEQQEQPQNNAFAGFEDLTSGEGGQNIPHDGTPTDPPSVSLL